MPLLESACLPFLCAERINLQLPAQARQPELRLGESMQPPWLLLMLALTLANGSALAQQPVRPLPKVGGCPLGYYASGSYCVPSASDNTRGALENRQQLPLGFYGSGNYCVSSPSNDREAIQKTGNSCPLGWFSSGTYCVKSR